MSKITVSVIKADIGGYVGHSSTHPAVDEQVDAYLEKHGDILEDFHVTNAGDDLQLIMTHRKGQDSQEIHELAWDAFQAGTDKAEELKLYGAGQDLLSDAFSGNVRGLGPGAAELEFTERPSDPVVVFGMDKTEPGAFNMPIYKMFGDPFTTAGLVIDPSMNEGFRFEVWDIKENRKIMLEMPEDMHELLALIGAPGRYVIKRVYPRDGNKNDPDEPVAAVSTEKLVDVAGEYVGKDDPVAVVRTQSSFPSPGEVLQPYANPPIVAGAMRGSHHALMYPITSDGSEIPSYFDGPPLIKAIGMVVNDGQFSEPVYPFDSSFWDSVRDETAERFRDFRERQGTFGPGTVEAAELEYGGWTEVMDDLEDRWELSVEGEPAAMDD